MRSVPGHVGHAEALHQAADRLERLVVGAPEGPDTELGPFTNQALVERIVRQVTGALAEGAWLLWPPSSEHLACPAPGGGTWLAPVVLADVQQAMAVMREESFGPVLPICTVGSVDEAVALAEDSAYGLSATVFGGPPGVAARLLRSHGLVFEAELWLDFYDREPLGPIGGFKRSGWVWEWCGGAFMRTEGARDMVREFSQSLEGGRQCRTEISLPSWAPDTVDRPPPLILLLPEQMFVSMHRRTSAGSSRPSASAEGLSYGESDELGSPGLR